jgi:hypothetical protein
MKKKSKKSKKSRISTMTPFQRYVDAVRTSPEFSALQESKEGWEKVLEDRWNAMSTDERKCYEQTTTMKNISTPEQSAPPIESSCQDDHPMKSSNDLASPSLSSSLPADDVLREFVNNLLKSADLSQLTKKNIRESIGRNFNIDPSTHREKINGLIESCLTKL